MWNEEGRTRSREDKRTRGLADYLNANTMLYRGALFPSRLFYNSICDPPAPGGGCCLHRVQASYARSFIVTLLNLCASIMTTSCSHFVYPSLFPFLHNPSSTFDLSFALLPPPPQTQTLFARPPLRLVFHFLILIFLFRTRLAEIFRFQLFSILFCCFVVTFCVADFFPGFRGKFFHDEEKERSRKVNRYETRFGFG